MRPRIWGTATVLVVLLAVPGCKTKQPTSSGSQTVTVTFDALANNDKWNCWDGPTGVYCVQDQPLSVAQRPVPWAYDVEISLIPKGSTTETIVASSIDGVDVPSAFPVFGNMTDFDSTTEVGPVCPPATAPYPCTSYTNPRKVTRGSRDYAAFQNFPLQEPNVLNRQENEYSFTASVGDTVIVRARKQAVQLWYGVVLNPLEQNTSLRLESTISVRGKLADANGTTVTSYTDGSGLSYSYTLR